MYMMSKSMYCQTRRGEFVRFCDKSPPYVAQIVFRETYHNNGRIYPTRRHAPISISAGSYQLERRPNSVEIESKSQQDFRLEWELFFSQFLFLHGLNLVRNLAVSWLGLRGPFPYHYFCERNKQLSRGLSIQFIGFWSNIIVFEGEYCISLTKNSTCMTYCNGMVCYIFRVGTNFPQMRETAIITTLSFSQTTAFVQEK